MALLHVRSTVFWYLMIQGQDEAVIPTADAVRSGRWHDRMMDRWGKPTASISALLRRSSGRCADDAFCREKKGLSLVSMITHWK